MTREDFIHAIMPYVREYGSIDVSSISFEGYNNYQLDRLVAWPDLDANAVNDAHVTYYMPSYDCYGEWSVMEELSFEQCAKLYNYIVNELKLKL